MLVSLFLSLAESIIHKFLPCVSAILLLKTKTHAGACVYRKLNCVEIAEFYFSSAHAQSILHIISMSILIKKNLCSQRSPKLDTDDNDPQITQMNADFDLFICVSSVQSVSYFEVCNRPITCLDSPRRTPYAKIAVNISHFPLGSQ